MTEDARADVAGRRGVMSDGRKAAPTPAPGSLERLVELDGLEASEVGGPYGVGPKALGQLRRVLASRGLSSARGEEDERLPEEEAWDR